MFFPTLLIAAMATGAESSPQDELDRKPLVVSTAGGRIEFSSENGGILAVRQKGGTGSIVISGEHGLWQVRFQDGSTLDAAGFAAGNKDREFSVDTDPTGQKLRLNYRSAAIQVTVSVIGTEDGVDLVGQVRPAEKTILDFALPARLRFDPGQVNRVVVPSSGNSSVGMAFRGSFFQRQSVDDAAAWQGKSVGPQGYVGLYGGYLTMRPMDDPPVPLRVTATGREWLGDSAAKRLEGSRATVNRPPGRGQADLVLVDSDKGAYFSAHRLGGTGALWRIGGFVHEKEAPLSRGLVTAALRKLVSTAPATRRKLGVVALARGPERGAGNHVAARDWLGEVRRTAAALNVVELGNVRELTAALAADNFLAIVNPYGELIPAEDEAGLAPMITAIGRFVRGGGNWFEVGGYSFFGVLRPVRYFDYHLGYPPAFADFLHVDTHTGKLAVFGVQPQHTTPWIGVTDRAAIFVPGRLGCGGDERGGYGDRTFGAFVKPGETWRAPASHLLVGQAAPESLLTYCTLNGITRKLDEKMSPAQLAKFRQAVLVFYTGNCAEMLAHVDKLPVPTLVHFSEYLKGGFDKEYPDHLPPQVRFGTPAEFRRFFDLCHTLGHLVMPYTNPTWWCDHPRGPTFQQAGEAPLLRTLDGKLSYERYSLNDGYTVCHWHPAVQKANRETVRQFTEDYPVDVLFQDQCGARSWHYDTNPASPTPLAYMDGLLSMVAEDCRRVPLSTESGWDRVVNFESQLCGLSWQLVPTEGGPEWRRYLKHMYPPKAWDIFPVAQFIAHDKTVLVHHDLGQFVTNPEVLAWTLGLGFSLSYRCPAASLEQDSPREWLRWLDRLQKSVCSRYIGQPLLTFEHDRGPRPTIADDGLLRATYGGSVPIKVVANLGSAARVEKEKHLAPHGFYTTAPGLVAGRLQRVGNVDIADDGVSFVMEGDAGKADLWIYSQADREVAVEIPQGMTGDVTVTFDKAEPRKISAAKGVVRLKLPPAAGKPRVTVPAALAGKAPRDWPGNKPAIGVLDLGNGLHPNWTRIQPKDWTQALQQSALSRVHGLAIKQITTVPELTAALQAGPTSWLAIINPYGENFPTTGTGQWQNMLARIRDYVNQGGSWWETAGYSFHQALSLESGRWQSTAVGPRGLAELGLPIGGGDIDSPPVPLQLTSAGKKWLGPELGDRIQQKQSPVNRGLPRGQQDPGHVTLVTGDNQDFIGGYRLSGWGWLWRIGGFWPDPEVALPVTALVLERLYTHPPEPIASGGVNYLWHATVRPADRER